MQDSLVGIVILNWNGFDLIKQCMVSLSQQTYTRNLIIVVDNGSSDGSKKWLDRQPEITTIHNRHNVGFAKAMNQGVRAALKANCDYIIALNNDTYPAKDWVSSLVQFMQKHPDVDFAQGANMQHHKRSNFDSTGIYLEKGLAPKQRALNSTKPQLNIPVIGPNAAGAIYRPKLLKEVAYKGEYFDERFFAYVEDVDFDLRCSLRGSKFGYVESAKLYHIGSASGQRVAIRKMYWGARNMVWLAYKNVPYPMWRQIRRSVIKSHLANLQYLWREQRKQFWAYLYGLLVGTLTLPLFVGKRRNNLSKQKLDNEAFINLLVPSNPPLTNPIRKLMGLLK